MHGGPRPGSPRHTYELYGPLSNGATQVIFEGTPNTPHPGRHFEIIERYGVTQYYTAPTLVRSLMGWFPDGVPAGYDLSSIRLLGTVGEAVNPEAWRWFRDNVGAGTAPVVDTWWQSETGATILSPAPTDTAFKPGCAARPLPGVGTRIVDEAGNTVPPGVQGFIVVDAPGPPSPGPCGGTRDATSIPTGASTPSRAGSSPATAPSTTTTATSGSSGGWTTPSTSPGTCSPRSRSNRRSSRTRTWWRPASARVADPKTGHAIVAFVVLRESAVIPSAA